MVDCVRENYFANYTTDNRLRGQDNLLPPPPSHPKERAAIPAGQHSYRGHQEEGNVKVLLQGD